MDSFSVSLLLSLRYLILSRLSLLVWISGSADTLRISRWRRVRKRVQRGSSARIMQARSRTPRSRGAMAVLGAGGFDGPSSTRSELDLRSFF